MLLAVKAGSTSVTSVELSVNTVLSMGDDEGLRKALGRLAYAITKLDFRENTQSAVPSVLARVKSDKHSFIKHIPAGREKPSQFVSNCLVLFLSCLCCNANHGSAHLSFRCAAPSFAYALGVLLHMGSLRAGIWCWHCLVHKETSASLSCKVFAVFLGSILYIPSTFLCHCLPSVCAVATVALNGSPKK